MNKFYDRNVQFYSDYDQAWYCNYEIKEILEDGTVLMDWEPTSDNIMKILTLESKLERHFMDLEERIDNCWV